MQANRLELGSGKQVVSLGRSTRAVNPVVALRALYELLEEYGPMWYTQEAHDLARAALREQNLS